MDSATLTQRIAAVVQERKGQDVVIIDVRGRSSYTDYLILVSGTSDRHVQAIAELVDMTLSHEGSRSVGREGLREGQWALIDFGSAILHVFHQFTRPLYNLEEMWRDAPRLALPELPASPPLTPAPVWAPSPS